LRSEIHDHDSDTYAGYIFGKERQVFVLKRIGVFVIIMSLAVGLGPRLATSGAESHVIGRITGTFQPLPGYFYKNPYMITMSKDEVEFTGFRLMRTEDGKRFLIRPNHEGFFHQGLPAGEYTLTRKRTDRPHHKEPKTIDIVGFEVKPGALVNLGTINILVNGKPLESLRSSQHRSKGTYIYSYRYEREPGDRAHDAPLNWFTKKKPSAADAYKDPVVREDAVPTSGTDGSKVILMVTVPPDDR